MGNCTCTESKNEFGAVNLGSTNKNCEKNIETEDTEDKKQQKLVQGLIRAYLYRKAYKFPVISEALQSFYNSLPQFTTQGGGKAVYFFDSGLYEGEINESELPNGYGKLIKSDCIVEGLWANGELNGKSRIVTENHEVFIGDFKNDLKDGYGEFIGATEFKGFFKCGKAHGKGIEKWKNGAYYEGDYAFGSRTGQGLFVWPDGSRYIGEFKGNRINGLGEYIASNGNKYKGQWKNNLMHGEGKFEWSNGKVYEGHYINNKKSGFGILTFSIHKKYEGNWKLGKQHGNGTLYHPSSPKSGMWRQGRFCG